MQCDLCGKEGNIVRTNIEGVEMSVCPDCAKFGRVLEPLKKPTSIARHRPVRKIPELEVTETVVSDFAQKIKSARERKGLKQEDFAKLLNEKASIIHKLETGSFIPPISLAKKLEKALGIKLVEQTTEEAPQKPNRSVSGSMTIGDLIKRK